MVTLRDYQLRGDRATWISGTAALIDMAAATGNRGAGGTMRRRSPGSACALVLQCRSGLIGTGCRRALGLWPEAPYGVCSEALAAATTISRSFSAPFRLCFATPICSAGAACC